MPIPGEVLEVADPTTTGGLIIAAEGAPAGGLVTEVGHLQYGRLLTGGSTVLRWITLTGWRSRPAVDLTDSPLPSSHGERAGSMYAQGVIVTYDCLLHGTQASKIAALDELDRHTPISDTEQQLVVDDGSGPSFRWARVIDLDYQQGVVFRPGPVAIMVAFKCADPRRYALTPRSVRLDPPVSSGGLVYPLEYPLEYGTVTSGTATATNVGNADSPATAVLYGPLERPRVRVGDRLWTFDLTLTETDQLTFDGRTARVLLNGTSDRSQNLTDDSALLEDFTVPPGSSVASLSATSGDGYAVVSFHDARM